MQVGKTGLTREAEDCPKRPLSRKAQCQSTAREAQTLSFRETIDWLSYNAGLVKCKVLVQSKMRLYHIHNGLILYIKVQVLS